MIGWLRQRWFESRALAVLQVFYYQPLKKPLPSFERQLLRGAVKLTLRDHGTPFDAATRFYAALAETTVGKGGSLDDIGFAGVLGRLALVRGRLKHFDEHLKALKAVAATERTRRPNGEAPAR